MTALFISLWAFLFTGPLSAPGEVFGWLKDFLNPLPLWLYKPLIGCAKCHAGQVALWGQAFEWYSGRGFDFTFILLAVGGAYALERLDTLIEAIENR